MAVVDLTLGLEGDVSSETCGRAARFLEDLLAAIAEQVAGGTVAWHPSAAETGGRLISVVGVCAGDDAAAALGRHYLDAARALVADEETEVPQSFQSAMAGIARLLGEDRALLRFETAMGVEWAPRPEPEPIESLGYVSGRHVPRSGPFGTGFVLMDEHAERAVPCYLRGLDQDLQRTLCGRQATVHGLVTYWPDYESPVSVRAIDKLELNLLSGDGASPAERELVQNAPGRMGGVDWFLEGRERARERFAREAGPNPLPARAYRAPLASPRLATARRAAGVEQARPKPSRRRILSSRQSRMRTHGARMARQWHQARRCSNPKAHSPRAVARRRRQGGRKRLTRPPARHHLPARQAAKGTVMPRAQSLAAALLCIAFPFALAACGGGGEIPEIPAR